MVLHPGTSNGVYAHNDSERQDVVDTRGASRFLGVSESWLNKLRVLNPEESPRYIKAGRRVLYRLSDLLAWQEARARGGRCDVICGRAARRDPHPA